MSAAWLPHLYCSLPFVTRHPICNVAHMSRPQITSFTLYHDMPPATGLMHLYYHLYTCDMAQVSVMGFTHLLYTCVSDVAHTPVPMLLPSAGHVCVPRCQLLTLQKEILSLLGFGAMRDPQNLWEMERLLKFLAQNLPTQCSICLCTSIS